MSSQAEFLAGQATGQPAARVTRMSRRPPQQQQQQQQPPEEDKAGPHAAAAQIQPPHSASQQQQQQAQCQEGPAAAPSPTEQQQQQPATEQLCPTIPGILTDVKERVFNASAPPLPGPPAAAAVSFPKAMHRKQSKVSAVSF
jgi:hypothetical protein